MECRWEIHLIEDREIDSLAFRRALKRTRYDGKVRIRRFAHGREALNLYESGERADLILIDINLPDLPGWSLLEATARMSQLEGVPRVMVSSSTNPADRERALKHGAVDYLEKPLGLGALAQSLEECFGRWLGRGESRLAQ